MANFITLEQLRKTTAALLEKIHSLSSKFVSKNDVFLDSHEEYNGADQTYDYVIGTIAEKNLYIPGTWVLNNAPSYTRHGPEDTTTPSLVYTGDMYHWNHLSVGYIEGSVLHVISGKGAITAGSTYYGVFYFYVPSISTSLATSELYDVANSNISSITFHATNGVIKTFNVTYAFTRSGLYKGKLQINNTLVAWRVLDETDADDFGTHRPIQLNGTEILGDNTTALNLAAGENITLSNNNGTVTIAAEGGLGATSAVGVYF